jgi:FAD-binding domain
MHDSGCYVQHWLAPQKTRLSFCRPGMYMFINVPAISYMEWHPFSTSSLCFVLAAWLLMLPHHLMSIAISHSSHRFIFLTTIAKIAVCLQPSRARQATRMCRCTFATLATGHTRCTSTCCFTQRVWR